MKGRWLQSLLIPTPTFVSIQLRSKNSFLIPAALLASRCLSGLAHAGLKTHLPPALLGCGPAGTVLEEINSSYILSPVVSPS